MLLERVHDSEGRVVAYALGFKPEKLDEVPAALRKAFESLASVESDVLPRFLYVCIRLDELERITGRTNPEPLVGSFNGFLHPAPPLEALRAQKPA